jgi:predicted nucleic acid-binding protein
MKRILFDTNVILDVLLDRKPHAEASAAAWALAEQGQAEGFLSAHAVTTLHYLIQKAAGNTKAVRAISSLLRVFAVAAVDGSVIDEALKIPAPDFEDAVTAASARAAGCEWIVTRDPKGFRGSPVRCLTPEAVLPLIARVKTESPKA